jgi:hypothetical protein
MLAEVAYKEPLLSYSLSDDGIIRLQSITSPGLKKFWLFQSNLGGGKELTAAVVVSFLLC